MPEFYMIFARKINKMHEFYTIFARKKFLPEFGGNCPPSPTPMDLIIYPIPYYAIGMGQIISDEYKDTGSTRHNRLHCRSRLPRWRKADRSLRFGPL